MDATRGGRARRLTLGTALSLFVSATTAAAGEAPRFLTPSDFLPDVVTQVDEPTFSDVVNQFVLDPDNCTQTLEADETAEGLYSLQFAEAQTSSTVLLQTIVVYTDATDARAAFKHHKATATGGVKCGSVDNLIEGAGTVEYERVKVPKVGDGSFGIGRGIEGGEPAVAIEFLSGRHVSILNAYGNDFSPTIKDLKALTRDAEKQLSSGA